MCQTLLGRSNSVLTFDFVGYPIDIYGLEQYVPGGCSKSFGGVDDVSMGVAERYSGRWRSCFVGSGVAVFFPFDFSHVLHSYAFVKMAG